MQEARGKRQEARLSFRIAGHALHVRRLPHVQRGQSGGCGSSLRSSSSHLSICSLCGSSSSKQHERRFVQGISNLVQSTTMVQVDSHGSKVFCDKSSSSVYICDIIGLRSAGTRHWCIMLVCAPYTQANASLVTPTWRQRLNPASNARVLQHQGHQLAAVCVASSSSWSDGCRLAARN